jgi:hypothetical protein
MWDSHIFLILYRLSLLFLLLVNAIVSSAEKQSEQRAENR